MVNWGRRKDNKKSYPKTGPKGVSGAGTDTSPVNDVHMKTSEIQSSSISNQEAFDDFWQVMGERGGIFDVLSDVGLDLPDVLPESEKGEAHTYVYWHIAPLQVNKEAQAKIVAHYGGYEGIREFMANNAGWEKYQKEFE